MQVIKKNGENIVTLYVKALGSLSLVATFTLEKGSKFKKCNYFRAFFPAGGPPEKKKKKQKTFLYIYMSSYARFVWVALTGHALKTVRTHRNFLKELIKI